MKNVKVHTIYGDELTIPQDKWEELWEKSTYAYLGKCMVNGDLVAFEGDLEQGYYTVSDGKEEVGYQEWYTEDE